MEIPVWVKPSVYGGICGAVAAMIVGFAWGGWVTDGTARKMATDQAGGAVVSALSSICVDQSKRDPQIVERVAALKAASSWSRGDLVMKNGWATMPGTTEANRPVASACADLLGT